MLIFTSVAWIDTLYKCHIENISTLKNNDEKPALYKGGFHGEKNGNRGGQEPQDSRYRVV